MMLGKSRAPIAKARKGRAIVMHTSRLPHFHCIQRPNYSMTRSARRRVDCGIVMPMARAVLRLTTSS